MSDAWTQGNKSSNGSPFKAIVDSLSDETVESYLEYMAMHKFIARDDNSAGEVIGARFPVAFKDQFESVVEEFKIRNKTQAVRMAMYTFIAIMDRAMDFEAAPALRQHLATQRLKIEMEYREAALSAIKEQEGMLRTSGVSDIERSLAESALKEFAVSRNNTVREAAERALEYV